MDYEAEKAKQEAIWQQFQEKRQKKGRGRGVEIGKLYSIEG